MFSVGIATTEGNGKSGCDWKVPSDRRIATEIPHGEHVKRNSLFETTIEEDHELYKGFHTRDYSL